MNSNDILIANTDDLRSEMDYLEKTLLKEHRIDPNLYEEYDVKRGLRDSTGRGVLTGLTEVSDVCGFDVINGRKIPAEGGLYYQGINVKDLVNGLQGKRFGFEETTFLLLFGRLPKEDELEHFLNVLFELEDLTGRFVRDVVMKASSPNIMNSLQRCVLTLYTYDENPEDISVENALRQSLELIAKLPEIAVYSYHGYRHFRKDDTLFIRNPQKGLSLAENILLMLRPDGKYTELEAKVLKVNDGEGMAALSYKRLAADKGLKRLKEAFENKEVLKEKVTQVMEKGLVVEVEGTRVFIPASMVSDTYDKDLSKYAGQEIEFVVTEFNPSGRRSRIIGDRKQILLEKKAAMQKELFEKIAVGQTVEGVVKNVTDFGAFIDLGGADGLLHISEMSWGRVENPKKVFKVGDKVKALIKDINGEKIALSLKFPESNPWANAAEKYAVGNVVEGKVARMTDFGAFVELEPGVDALLHVSQISREHVAKPADVLSIGQEITAKIVDFNEADRKISLSMKALQAPAEQNEADAE